MTDDRPTDDPSPEEARLTLLFRRLGSPASARRWAQPRPVAGAGRWAPLAVAAAVALTTGGAGLALHLHGRQSDPASVTPAGLQTGRPVVTATAAPSPTGQAAPIDSPGRQPTAPTPPGAVAAGFQCAVHSGGTPGAPGQLTAVRTAHQPGFDRITFEFASLPAGTAGVPEYRVTPQGSAMFTGDASGRAVTADGTAGLRIVIRNASGVGLDGSPTYHGGTDLKPALPTLREVTELGDFERVLTWGAGLASAGCVRVTALAGPPRLVIDVQSVG